MRLGGPIGIVPVVVDAEVDHIVLFLMPVRTVVITYIVFMHFASSSNCMRLCVPGSRPDYF